MSPVSSAQISGQGTCLAGLRVASEWCARLSSVTGKVSCLTAAAGGGNPYVVRNVHGDHCSACPSLKGGVKICAHVHQSSMVNSKVIKPWLIGSSPPKIWSWGELKSSKAAIVCTKIYSLCLCLVRCPTRWCLVLTPHIRDSVLASAHGFPRSSSFLGCPYVSNYFKLSLWYAPCDPVSAQC